MSARGRHVKPASASSRGRRDDGVAAVEFAIIAPVFITIIVGIIIYGVYFATLIAVTDLASETARAAIAGLTVAEQQAIAQARFTAVLTSYAPLLTTQNSTLTFPTAPVGSFSVKISYNFASFGFATITLLPVPATVPSVTVEVSTGSP